MFEKEAEEYVKEQFPNDEFLQSEISRKLVSFAEYAYNKANEWHYVKDGDLPPEDTKVLALMADKEICIAHFYRRNVWDKIGTVIAWKEIVLPKESE